MNTQAVVEMEIRACGDLAAYAAACAAWLDDPDAAPMPVIGGDRSVARLQRALPHLHLNRAPDMDAASGFAALSPAEIMGLQDRPGDPDRVTLVEQGCSETVPALFYALATGRRVIFSDGLSGFRADLAGARTAILAAPAGRFTKAVLNDLLEWLQTHADAPRESGIMTGRDVAQLSLICARLLIVRRSHANGIWQADRETAGDDAACEFEIIGAHGNEIHLNYRHDAVLCGRAASPDPASGSVFDCGRNCPLENRVDASRVAANTVLLMSCDAFTPSDGLAPGDFSILLRLLDGQAAAILAPFKHVQANEPLLIMIESLARSGYSLGETAFLVNARANAGMLADYGFFVLGDPEIRAAARDRSPIASLEIVETSRGAVIRGALSGECHAFTIPVPDPGGDAALAILPISENMRRAGVFFALGWSGAAGRIDVTLFSETAFEPAPFELALMPAHRPGDDDFTQGRQALKHTELLTHVFGRSAPMSEAEADLRQFLNAAAAFPRPIELSLGQHMALSLKRMSAARIARLRSTVCDRIHRELGRRRIWISHDYADLFGDIRRAGEEHDAACSHCDNRTVVWAYADRIGGLPDRHVSICNRCGITADAPAASPLRVSFKTIGTFRRTKEAVEIRITNTSAVPTGISLAVQLNEWEQAGLSGTACRADIELGAHETHTHAVQLSFPDDFQDDILSLQLFVVDAALNLLFFSQKIRSEIRS